MRARPDLVCTPPGQRTSSRITTRGNPPETDAVSAALAHWLAGQQAAALLDLGTITAD